MNRSPLGYDNFVVYRRRQRDLNWLHRVSLELTQGGAKTGPVLAPAPNISPRGWGLRIVGADVRPNWKVTVGEFDG